MFDPEYTFGTTMVYCDRKDCKQEMEVEGFDGHCLPFEDVAKEIKEYGWTVKFVDGAYMHLCSQHSEELAK